MLSTLSFRVSARLAFLFIQITFISCKPFGSSQEGSGNFHPGISTPLPSNQIAAGSTSACLIINGGLQCIGANNFGQLGNGSAAPSDSPVSVTGLSSGVTDISLSYFHACAVKDGAAYCWGRNLEGEVGNGTFNNIVSTPAMVTGLSSGVTRVFAGSFIAGRSCALQNGILKCWGMNNNKEFADGTTTNSLSPVTATSTPSSLSEVAVGTSTATALAAGAVYTWGLNWLGQGSASGNPTAVASLSSGVTQVAANHWRSCAIKSSQLYCWGFNENGDIGDGTLNNTATPVAITEMSSVTSVSIGWRHTCALTSAGAVYCWGANNGRAIGDGTTTDRLSPTLVTGLETGVTAIAAGITFSIAIKDGHAYWWGNLPTDIYKRSGGNPQPTTVVAIPTW